MDDGGTGDRTYGTPVLYPNYDGVSTFAPGGASRIPDGYDTESITDWVRNEFDLDNDPNPGEAYNTPGALNQAYTEAAADPKINEFSASTTGTDVEFVEMYGDPNTDYSAYTMLEIEGDSDSSMGLIDEVIPMGTTDGNGLFLVNLAANKLENGTISLLLVKDFSGAFGDDIDADDDGVIDNGSWLELTDSVAVDDGGTGDRTYGTPVLYPNYDGVSTFAPGGASRIPDGYDTESITDWVRNEFDLNNDPVMGEAYNTPGAFNVAYTPPPEACGDAFTPTYEIQGSGFSTPLDGTVVSTEGIVVGDFQADGYVPGTKNGFFIQALTGDGLPETSDGLFIYYYGSDVQVGDHVRVRGEAEEYYDITQIGSVSQVWVCESGLTLPDPSVITLPLASELAFEAYEGMLVTLPQELVISEYYNFGRFGEIKLTTERYMTFTALYEPDPTAYAAWTENYTLNSITLDDGRTSQNPDPAIHPNGAEFDLTNLFRGGDRVANVTGIMDHDYDLYRIQPTQAADYIPVNLRPATYTLDEGDLKIASFNVLNYFTTIDTGAEICGPAGTMECRGADTAEELTRQRDKILSAMAQIDADIFGLMEIENDKPLAPGEIPDYAVADLVDGLNSILGAGTYDYISTGAIGTDAIKVALLYKPAAVTPLGDYQVLTSAIDPRFNDLKNRPTLAQTFIDHLTGQTFTVAVNHLKSKGSDCLDVGDPDLYDGAGNCNLTRKTAAEAMVDWLANPAYFAEVSKTLIIGDLNSYDKEDPIDVIKSGADDMLGTADDFVDMVFQEIGENAYGYVFDGQIGYLDYALASTNLVSDVVDVTIWHINADEPSLIDYDMTFKQDPQDALYEPNAYRSSDHDPVIVSLTFEKKHVSVDIKPGSCENPLNLNANGVLPVAVMGTADFDVMAILPETILLGGSVPPVRWSFEDIGSTGACGTTEPDGYMDLVLHFEVSAIAQALEPVSHGDLITIPLTGEFTAFGMLFPFEGADTVTILKNGKN